MLLCFGKCFCQDFFVFCRVSGQTSNSFLNCILNLILSSPPPPPSPHFPHPAQQEAEISRLNEQLEDESRCHANELRRMEMIHLDEISSVKETLQSNHRKEIQTSELSRATLYRKTSSRGAYGHDPWSVEVFLKNIHLISQDQIVQWHYL